MKRPTIADVAAHVGVSKSTVSHALSGKRPISQETRARIFRAVEELGYQPNLLAQQLAGSKSTRTIAFVFPLLSPRIADLEMKFIAATASIINQAKFAFLLITHLDHDYNNLHRFVHSGLVDGVILMQVHMHDSRVKILRDIGIPFVLVGRCSNNTGLAYVDSDIKNAIQQAVTYLAELGHRGVVYLHQPESELGFMVRAIESYVDTCHTFDMPALMFPCALSPESGRAAMENILNEHPQVTSAIVWNDLAMLGAVQAIKARGLQIPEDISLICFDSPDSAHLYPFTPTVIEIGAEKIAAEAAQLMIDLLDGRSRSMQQLLIPPQLMVGDSTAAPARTILT
jgi:DNA-binding LacI/PurR family transcriptional regulator